jgi:hypothetical protein
MATLAKAISKTIGAEIQDYTKGKTGAHGKLTAVCDLLVADGHTDLLAYRAPAKGEDRTFYDSCIANIVKGFPAHAQKLCALPKKEVPEADHAERIYWLQRKGADMGDIRNAMERRLKREGSKGATTPVAPETKILEALTAASKKAEKLETPNFDVVTFNKHINAAIKILAGK